MSVSDKRPGDGGYDSGTPFNVFVSLPRHLDGETYRKRYEQGLEPDVSPYGFHHAEYFGARTFFASGDCGNRGVANRLLTRFLGFDLRHQLSNRRNIAKADVIWTMLESEVLGTAVLMTLGLAPRKPIVGSVVYLCDRWPTFGPVRKAVYRRLLRQAGRLFIHSAPCADELRRIVPGVKVTLLHFGIARESFLAPTARRVSGDANERPIRIVAAGHDRTRDWSTLVLAFGGDERFSVKIASPWVSRKQIADFGNIEICRPSGYEALKRLYQEADVIAVPMVENLYAGITVALEGAAMGVPVLSSRTGGVPTYFSDDEIIYAPPGDPAAIREALLVSRARWPSIAEKAREKFLGANYTSQQMMVAYVEATRELLEETDEHRC